MLNVAQPSIAILQAQLSQEQKGAGAWSDHDYEEAARAAESTTREYAKQRRDELLRRAESDIAAEVNREAEAVALELQAKMEFKEKAEALVWAAAEAFDKARAEEEGRIAAEEKAAVAVREAMEAKATLEQRKIAQEIAERQVQVQQQARAIAEQKTREAEESLTRAQIKFADTQKAYDEYKIFAEAREMDLRQTHIQVHFGHML